MRSLKEISDYYIDLISDNFLSYMAVVEEYGDDTPKDVFISNITRNQNYEIIVDVSHIDLEYVTLKTDFDSLMAHYNINIYVIVTTSDERIITWLSNYIDVIIRIFLDNTEYQSEINTVDISSSKEIELKYTKMATINIKINSKE